MPELRWDRRIGAYRVPAYRYAVLRATLGAEGVAVHDLDSRWFLILLGKWESGSCQGRHGPEGASLSRSQTIQQSEASAPVARRRLPWGNQAREVG